MAVFLLGMARTRPGDVGNRVGAGDADRKRAAHAAEQEAADQEQEKATQAPRPRLVAKLKTRPVAKLKTRPVARPKAEAEAEAAARREAEEKAKKAGFLGRVSSFSRRTRAERAFTLTVTAGPARGQTFTFDQPDCFLFGRAADARVSLPR